MDRTFNSATAIAAILLAACVFPSVNAVGKASKSRSCPCELRAWTSDAVGVSTTLVTAAFGEETSGSYTVDTATPPFRSPAGAFNRSLLGTLIPLPTLILTVPGIVVGPSLGYFYGGKPGRAWMGIGLRVAGLGGMVSSFAICGWDCGPGDSGYDMAWIVFIAGGGLTVGSAIVDIATVKGAVRKRNEEVGAQPIASIGPIYLPNAKTVGLGVRIRI